MNNSKNLALAISTIISAGTFPPTVLAQTSAFALEEVVVTAERREQNVQDIAISATVVSGEELTKRGVNYVNDLQQVAPSLSINTYNRQTFINIRGIGVNRSAPTTSPGVAYYVDGVLIPNDKFVGYSFFDIGSVEVLRGPQGTLAGQNSTGGAIFVRTPNVEFDNVSGFIDTTIGDYGSRKFVGAVNAAGDNLGFRLSAIHDEKDSFTDNIGPASSNPGSNSLDAARLNVRYQTDDGKLDVNLRGEYFDADSDGNAVKSRNDLVTSDPFTIEEDADSYSNQRGYISSLEARYDLTDSVQIRGVMSKQSGVTTDLTDGDRTASSLAIPTGLPATSSNRALYPGRVGLTETNIDTTIYEVNLLSTDSSSLQWVVGAFSMDQDTDTGVWRDNHHTVDFVQADSTIDTSTSGTSQSLFGQISYYMTDRLEGIVGARRSWDEQKITRRDLPGPGTFPNSSTAKSSEWTGKLGLNYHLDNSMLYASLSKGYKAGGTNLQPDSPNFSPETNLVYELGFKTEILDSRLRVNGDVFYSDYQDIQLASLSDGLPLTENAASGDSWGFELEMLGQFDALGFNVGIGYLDSAFADDACLNDSNSTITSTQCGNGNRLVSAGNDLPYSPEWTINAGMQYEFYLQEGMVLTPRLQWNFVDSQIATPFPSDKTDVASHNTWDFRLTLDVNDKYKVEGFVKNITDETYIASQIQDSSTADGGYIYGEPRTAGVRFKMFFGG